VLALLAACGDEQILITPVVERPIDDEADALPELTQIRIALENAGTPEPFDVFARGETISLDDVPLLEGLVLRLDGFVDGRGVAVGRSCPFSLADGNRPEPRVFLSSVVRTGLLEIEAEPRRGGASLVLADGTVFLVGGEGSASLELYDPRTGLIAAVDHQPFPGRTGAAIATFEDGSQAILGGRIGTELATEVVLVSPNGDIARVPDGNGLIARANLSATTLSGGQILLTGGSDALGVASNLIVEMSTVEASQSIKLERVNSASLARARERHVVTPLGDAGASLLITGGNDNVGLVAQSEIYRPNGDDLIALASPAFDLKHPRTGHRAALLPDETVVIVGGVDGAGNPVRQIERFSLIDGSVPINGVDLPMDAPAVDFGIVTLPSGQILLVGGRANDDPLAPPLTHIFTIDFDSTNNTVSLNTRDALAVPRIDPQLSVLCDGTVLITGGTDGPAAVERFNPNVQPKL
jgi:hypothetical protein